MPTVARGQRLPARRILSVELLETRRLLSSTYFLPLLPFLPLSQDNTSVISFLAQFESFLNVHHLNAPENLQPSEPLTQVEVLDDPASSSFQLDDHLLLEETCLDPIGSGELALEEDASPFGDRLGEPNLATGDSAGEGGWDGVPTSDLERDMPAGEARFDPSWNGKLPLSLTDMLADPAAPGNATNPVMSMQLPLGMANAERIGDRLPGRVGGLFPKPVLTGRIGEANQDAVEPQGTMGNMLADIVLPLAPNLKPSPRGPELAANADPLVVASRLVEGARSVELRTTDPQSLLMVYRPERPVGDPGLAAPLQQPTATPHRGHGTAEDQGSRGASSGPRILDMEVPPEAQVVIGTEGMAESATDAGQLAPCSSGMLRSGWRMDTAALDRALQQFLGQANDLGQELSRSLHLMGASPWLLGLALAGTAYGVVRRQQRVARRGLGLTSGEGRSTLTWIAGLPGSLSTEES